MEWMVINDFLSHAAAVIINIQYLVKEVERDLKSGFEGCYLYLNGCICIYPGILVYEYDWVLFFSGQRANAKVKLTEHYLTQSIYSNSAKLAATIVKHEKLHHKGAIQGHLELLS